MTDRAPWYRWAVLAYDRGYRVLHGLNRPEAQAGPVLLVERRRLPRALRLADGTRLRPGAPIGVLHLDNARVLELHGDGRRPGAIGFELRRLVVASLRRVASHAIAGGPLAPLEAYSATTLFHRRLPSLGFGPALGDRPVGSGLVGGYQRALLRALHPSGAARARGTRGEARRLWISRERLVARYRRDSAVRR